LALVRSSPWSLWDPVRNERLTNNWPLSVEIYCPFSHRSGSAEVRGVARNQQTLTTDDAMALSLGSEHVSDVVPEISTRFQFKYGNKNLNLTTIGTTPNYSSVHGFVVAKGSFISAADEAARSRVVVLGSEIPGMLDADPAVLVGQTVQIRSISFKIVGIMASKGGSGWRNPDDDVWIPLSTAQFRVTGNEFVETISAKVSDTSTVPMAMLEIERVLRREHGVLPGKDNDFAIMNRKQFAESRQEATQVFTYLLAGIAGVSLVVGGIGIMNIMLVTVTERTREIGVRKALGATKGNILLQFLVESTILCLLGGLIGLALGAATSALLARYAGWQTVVTSSSAITAFGFSAAVGMVFGIWPARRAAALDPIEALRHE